MRSCRNISISSHSGSRGVWQYGVAPYVSVMTRISMCQQRIINEMTVYGVTGNLIVCNGVMK